MIVAIHKQELTIVLLQKWAVTFITKVAADQTLEVAEFHNGIRSILETNIRVIVHAYINSSLIRLDLPLHGGRTLNPGHPASQRKTAIECIAEGEVTDGQTDHEPSQTGDSNNEP